MKKHYVSPHSEVIEMETDHSLLSTSGYTDKEDQIQLDGETETDEQW
mgnify:CR=1 FL=1